MQAMPAALVSGLVMVWYASCVPIISVMLLMNTLRRYSLKRKLPIQYSFFDLYILMAMLSLSGVVLSTIPEMEQRMIAIGVIWLGLASSWYYGVRLVSRSGITDMRRRLLIQLVATPFAACGPYMLLALMIGLIGANKVHSPTLTLPEPSHVEFLWTKIYVSAATAEVLIPVFWVTWVLLVALYFVLPPYLSRKVIAEQGEAEPAPAPATEPIVESPPVVDPLVNDPELK